MNSPDANTEERESPATVAYDRKEGTPTDSRETNARKENKEEGEGKSGNNGTHHAVDGGTNTTEESRKDTEAYPSLQNRAMEGTSIKEKRTSDADGAPAKENAGDHREKKEQKKRIYRDMRDKDKEKATKEKSGWAINLTAGPRYLFKRLNPTKDLYFLKKRNNKNDLRGKNSSFAVQLHLEKKLSDRVGIYGTMGYTTFNSTAEYTYSNILSDRHEVRRIDKTSVEVIGFSEDRQNTIESSTRTLALGFGGNYMLSDRAHVQRLGLGVSIGHLKQVHFTSDVETHILQNTPYVLSLNFQWEHLYQVSPHWELSVGPYISYTYEFYL